MKVFATFGSEQLDGFDVNPMKTMVGVKGATENMLRAILRQKPFDNKYCTTYKIERAEEFEKDYGCKLYELSELMEKYTKE